MHERTEVAVGNEKYLFCVHILDYLHSRGRGHANVADLFEGSGGVYIAHHFPVRLFCLYSIYHLSVHLLCHGATCKGIGKVDVLVRGEHLCGLRHKMNAAHNYIFAFHLCRLHRQLIGIACYICDLDYLLSLVAMGKDTYILLFFELDYFLLNIIYHSFILTGQIFLL